MVALKDGTEVEDPRLDRIYEEDWNSLNYPVTLVLEQTQPYDSYEPRSYSWDISATLDQGQDGACVGFSFTQELICTPDAIFNIDGKPLDNKYAKEQVYWAAQRIDEWPGGEYPGASPRYFGTSVLAGAKVIQNIGMYANYYWALDLKQLVLAIGYVGPVVLGIPVHRGFMNPDQNGFVNNSGDILGGHAILAKAVTIVWKDPNGPKTWENVDLDKSYLTLHNSWGPHWGINGECKISLANVGALLTNQGEGCIPVRRVITPPPPTPPTPTHTETKITTVNDLNKTLNDANLHNATLSVKDNSLVVVH